MQHSLRQHGTASDALHGLLLLLLLLLLLCWLHEGCQGREGCSDGLQQPCGNDEGRKPCSAGAGVIPLAADKPLKQPIVGFHIDGE
jgi:hypothetical protein